MGRSRRVATEGLSHTTAIEALVAADTRVAVSPYNAWGGGGSLPSTTPTISSCGVRIRHGGKVTNSQARIASVIETSREELLDLGLRNPLLNYRPSRARGVEVVDELPAEVFRILVRERKAMSFKAAPEKSDGEEDELLVQPGDDDGQGGIVARHVDT